MLRVFLAAVMAIMNARPLVPVSTVPDIPKVLTPTVLLKEKDKPHYSHFRDFDTTNLHDKQLKQVQSMADASWKQRTVSVYLTES